MLDGATLNLLNNTTFAATRGFLTGNTVTISGASLTVPTGIGGAGTVNYTGFGTLTIGTGTNFAPHNFSVGDFGTLAFDGGNSSNVFFFGLAGTDQSNIKFEGNGATFLYRGP